MLDIICDLFMLVCPEYLSEKIFIVFYERVKNKIKNKCLRIIIFTIGLILSIAIAIGLAFAIICVIVWILKILNILYIFKF